VSAAGFRFTARITVHAPADAIAARINPAVGVVEPVDERSCVLATGADSVETVAVYLGLLDADFTVTGPPELIARLRVLAERYRRACGRAGGDARARTVARPAPSGCARR